MDQLGPFLNQAMAAFAFIAVGPTRHREHLSSVFQGHFGGDQRTAASGRLDHHGADGNATDDAVAGWKTEGFGLGSQGVFAQEHTGCGNHCKKFFVLGRINDIQPTAHHGHRFAARRRQSPLVGGLINSAGPAADDGDAARRQIRSQPGSYFTAVTGGRSGPDDGHHWLLQYR